MKSPKQQKKAGKIKKKVTYEQRREKSRMMRIIKDWVEAQMAEYFLESQMVQFDEIFLPLHA